MSPLKETDNQILYLFPRWVRILGVICFIFAAGFGYAFVVLGILDRNIVLSILFACVAFFFFLGGVYCCKATKVIFNHAGRRITIKGFGPFRRGTARISKEQVERVTVESAAEVAWYGDIIYEFGEEAVSIRLKGRKRPINIITMDDADHLTNSIAEFLRGSNN